MGAVRALQAPRDASLGLSEGPPCPCSRTATANKATNKLERARACKTSMCLHLVIIHLPSIAQVFVRRGIHEARLFFRKGTLASFLARRPGGSRRDNRPQISKLEIPRGHVGRAVPLRRAPRHVRGARRLRLLHPARLHPVFGRGVAHGAAEGQGRLDPYLLTKLTATASAPGETPSKLRPGQERVFLRRRGRRAGRHKHGRRHQ